MIDRLDTPTYSLVIPVFNEEECLPELIGRLRALMGRLDGATEVAGEAFPTRWKASATKGTTTPIRTSEIGTPRTEAER